MSHENNDFLGADLYKDISGSIASSLNSILGSRRNSIVVQVQPAVATTEDLDTEEDNSDSDSDSESSEESLTENLAFIVVETDNKNQIYPIMSDPEVPGPPNYNQVTGNSHQIKFIGGAVVVFIVAVLAIGLSSLHEIEEGNVGVYYKNGALMEAVSFPGIHYMTPFIVRVVEIKVRPETETLAPMTSDTKDGIQNTFGEVQVITSLKMDKLIYLLKNYGPEFKKVLVLDRIKEELRIFCANSTIDEVYNTRFLEIVGKVRENVIDSIERLGDGGINLLNLVIPKPSIPRDIANNYKRVKVQWTEQLVATQQQKTESIIKETEKLRAIADAERAKAVLEIKIQERILEKEGDANISALNNEILKQKEENVANIEKYKILSEASANKELYTPEYIQYNMAKNMANNTKYYFSGQDSLLNGVLTKIFN